MVRNRHAVFGIAMRNFTRFPEMPSAKDLIQYGIRAEELGYESVWAWDHILLGVDPSFPIHEALIILTAVAARTSRIKLGTGVLVLPTRNPVVLAKELATIDHVSEGRLIFGAAVGWYKREFDSLGIDFSKRGKIMEAGLDIIQRLWSEDRVDGQYLSHHLRGAVLYPKPVQKPRPPILIGGYVEAVLRRAATKGDGWLTYFYTPESFAKSWTQIREFATAAGRDPDSLISTNQLPICVGRRDQIEPPMKEWLSREWDYASWSESTMESAIMGTVEECVEQLERHLATGIDRIIFVPYKYQAEQVEIIAREIIPRLNATAAARAPAGP
jgi:probable F420-dependent oxidoreductase